MDLHLSEISHAYDGTEVLKAIDFRIPAGQIVCLIGPSGCGKSTLLRFIGGLEQPTEGQVLQLGDPPPESLNPLTYIFQDFALLPWRTVRGNISLVLEDHGIRGSKADEIIRDVLDRIGDKWTVLVVLRLGRRKERFRSLLRAVDGISQRMLTVTLRALERDGLVHRQVFDTRPPSVEYSLTPLGRSLLGTIDALARWAVDNEASVNAARVDFDQRNGADT